MFNHNGNFGESRTKFSITNYSKHAKQQSECWIDKIEIKNVEKIPTVREKTEESTYESEDIENTTDEGQMTNVEDTTKRGEDTNVERTNNGMIEDRSIKEVESESGEQTANEDQKAIIEEDTLSEQESENLEDTSSESDKESGEETTGEDEDKANRQTINQENRVDMNKIVTYHGKDNYQSLNSVGLTPVEKSNNEMTSTETNSGDINHECVNKENSITVSPKTMAINVQGS